MTWSIIPAAFPGQIAVRTVVAALGIFTLSRCGDAGTTTNTGSLSETISLTNTSDNPVSVVAPGTVVKATYRVTNPDTNSVLLSRPNSLLADLIAVDSAGRTVAGGLASAAVITDFTVPGHGYLDQVWTWDGQADTPNVFVPQGTYQIKVGQANSATPPPPSSLRILSNGLTGTLQVLNASNQPITSFTIGDTVHIVYTITNPTASVIRYTSAVGPSANLLIRNADEVLWPHAMGLANPTEHTITALGGHETVSMDWTGESTSAPGTVSAGTYVIEVGNYFPGGPALRANITAIAPIAPTIAD